jgi:hypothetical protein
MHKYLRTLFVFSFLSVSFSCFAIDYVFTGNGDWTNPNNWKGGIVPPASLQAGSTITINGSTSTGTSCRPGIPGCTNYTDPFSACFGTITIAPGGSLSFNNYTQFSFHGTIIVDGTMNTSTTMEIYDGSNTYINGILNVESSFFGNQGTVTINNGGVINNKAIFTNTGSPVFQFPTIGRLIINAGGVFNNTAIASFQAGKLTNNGTVSNQAILSGNATITGNLTNDGTLAPGNSPGNYSVTGDYTATATAVHNWEVGGTGSSNYDQLNVSGNVYLNGTLNVSLINGFVPSAGNADLPIITGIVNGTFASANIPPQYELIYKSNSVALRPSSVLPVIFSNVDVKKDGNSVRVSWKIQTEVNVSHYEIEKSNNGKDFRKIGEVGAASLSQYRFSDVTSENKTFYRIKSVDKDGKFSYSIVITYSQGKSAVTMIVFPSLTKGVISIQHSSALASSKIVVSAIDGRMMKTIFPVPGTQKTSVDVSGLKGGVYVVRYYNGNSAVDCVKFIKQ